MRPTVRTFKALYKSIIIIIIITFIFLQCRSFWCGAWWTQWLGTMSPPRLSLSPPYSYSCVSGYSVSISPSLDSSMYFKLYYSSTLLSSWWFSTLESVVAERLRAPNSNSGVSDQQSVGSNPQPWHSCPYARHITIASSFGWDVKPLVPCVV